MNGAQVARQNLAFPPPWEMQASGLVLILRGSRSLQGEIYSGPLAALMLVNYDRTPVGPYKELLFIPGMRPNKRGRHFSISQIWVDSHESVQGGRENWGIPKHYAEFEWQEDDDHLMVNVQDGGATFFSAAFRLGGFRFPIVTGPFFPMLYQTLNGMDYWTKPTASGRGRLAKVESMVTTHAGLPSAAEARVIAAVKIDSCEMVFPYARYFAG